MEAKKGPDEFKMGVQNDMSSKGTEAMRGPDMMIHENSVESEILLNSSEHVTDLLSGDAEQKRFKFNGGAFNSSEKQGKDTPEFHRGLCFEQEGSDDSEGSL